MIAGSVVACLLAAGMLAGAAGVGLGLARIAGPTAQFAPGPERWALAAGLGLGALSHVWLVLGAFGLYRAAVAWLVWLAGLLIFVLTVRGPDLSPWDARPRESPVPGRALGRALPAVLVTLGALSIAGALAPPFSIDLLRHHLGVARLFVRAGGLAFEPIVLYLQPLGGEMFYVWALLLGHPIAAKVLLAGCVLLTTVAVAVLADRHGGRGAGVIAATIVLATTWMWYFPLEGKIDALFLLQTALALSMLDAWRAAGGGRRLALAGVLVGLAASSKLLGLYVLAAATALVALAPPAAARPLRARATATALFVIGAAIAGAPWYIRTWWLTGDPLWPMLAPWLGGLPGSAALYRDALVRLAAHVSVGTAPWSFVDGLGAMVAGAPVLYGRGLIGPLLLAGLPLVALAPARGAVGWLGLFGLAYYAVWFPLDQQGRYLLPALLALAVPAALGLDAAVRLGGIAARAAVTAVLLWGGTSAALAAWQVGTLVPVVIGREPIDAFLGRTTSYHAELAWMNAHLPADAVVASDWDVLYYLDRRQVWLADFQGYVDARAVRSVDEYARARGRWGVTHLFLVGTVDEAAVDGDRSAVFAHALAARCGRVLYANPTATIVTSVTLARRQHGAATVIALDAACGERAAQAPRNPADSPSSVAMRR